MGNNLFSVVNSVTGNVILTQGRYGFQNVIEDFSDAQYVNIVTYNINSYRVSELLFGIKNIRLDTPINLILNIPKKSYGSADAANQIYWYLKTLDRQQFNDLNVYFNFSNHAKLVMTNNKLYIGSQNFSDASSDNIELGIVIENRNDIEKIKEDVFDVIKSNSIRYATSDYVLVMEEIKESMEGILCKIRSSLFTSVGDPPYVPETEVFDIDHAYFPDEEWSSFIDLEKNLLQIIERIGEEYNGFFNDSKANHLKEELKIKLRSFISYVDDFRNYINSSKNRLWDKFREFDIGETDGAMNMALAYIDGEKDDKFSHLNGEQLLVMFDEIEPVIKGVLDLIEDIKYKMLEKTIYENIELIRE